ncbi:MAG: hypothetical protein AAF938_18970 [Myxococcota bacterium]
MKTVTITLAAGLCACAATHATGPTAAISADRLAPIAADEGLRPYEPEAIAMLPQAPWQGAAIEGASLDADVREVLESAENTECAPMVPAGISAVPSRAAALDGGWSLEFDAPGAAGVSEEGSPCESCGRSSFGVAGTAMDSEALETGEMLQPAFADGSVQTLTAEEGVASAMIATDEDCVYQVWSFQGESHLNELLESLRFVALEPATDTAVATQ